MNYFQIASILSPFIAAILASLLSYSFTTRTKRKEFLYQNRLEAFKLIAAKITSFKKYCIGKIALHSGHEFSPYYDEEGSGLTFRTEIANEAELNQLFLTRKSRNAIDSLLGNMSLVCNAELHAPSSADADYGNVYDISLRECEKCLEVLYKELNLGTLPYYFSSELTSSNLPAKPAQYCFHHSGELLSRPGTGAAELAQDI